MTDQYRQEEISRLPAKVAALSSKNRSRLRDLAFIPFVPATREHDMTATEIGFRAGEFYASDKVRDFNNRVRAFGDQVITPIFDKLYMVQRRHEGYDPYDSSPYPRPITIRINN